ncbi:zinc-alpha-2-glycoprotein-like [Anguilla anguilla]|uniref:zinc-alpha-2-glycoprotein-like n=1 Tax=Anguilla anguilla TaxID=7936 RepID=UPI0015A8264C|nr:zinc-alpha-2-glycoprotein-like [Anguilla anguilla]
MRIQIIFSLLCTVFFSLHGAKETMIRYQYSGIVGGSPTRDTLTIDSVPIAWSDGRNNGFLSINTECEGLFRMTLRMITRSFNHTTTNNHTYQRTHECLLEGHRVLRVSDRIHYDGAEYLCLDSAKNTWMAAVPQALALKQKWDRQSGCTERHKVLLQNGCTELIEEFSRDKHSAPVFLCQFMVSFLISMHGSRVVGGVLGSIIHYPQRNVGIKPSKGDPEEHNLVFTPSKGVHSSLLVIPT